MISDLKAAVLEEHEPDDELTAARPRWNGACLEVEGAIRRDEARHYAQHVDMVDLGASDDRRL